MQGTIFDRFNDSIKYEKFVGTNNFNERTFATPTTIKCRIVRTDSIVKNVNEELVESKYKIYTKTLIDNMDRINDLDVLRIKEHKSLVTNEVLGYSIFI